MRLTRLVVTNHKRLSDVDVEVRDHLVLVGSNDVGKSSLLRCLDLLLGSTTAQLYARISAEDVRDPTLPMVVEADLTALTADEEALFPDEVTVEFVNLTRPHRDGLKWLHLFAFGSLIGGPVGRGCGRVGRTWCRSR